MGEKEEVPTIGVKQPTEGETRVMGGFLVESPYQEENLELIQYQLPVGIQRVAKAYGEDVETDISSQ